MTQLNGYAIKISWLGADHTYVTSSDGYAWPCWGRQSGGRMICSGTGSSNQANCISQTDSYAGIIYGVTGVCHQTANRILYPARVVVSNASGYWASIILYGTYGTSNLPALVEWEARKARCSTVSGDMGTTAQAAAPKSAPVDEALRDYLDKVDAIYAKHTRTITLAAPPPGTTEIDFLAQELELLVDYRLGTEKAVNKVAALRDLQADVLREKQGYDQALISKKLTTEQYAQKVNGLMAKLMEKSAALLGKDAHTKLFGIAPGVSFGIVDPKILAKHHQVK